MILKVLSNLNDSITFYDIQEEEEKDFFCFETEGQSILKRNQVKWKSRYLTRNFGNNSYTS